MLSKSDIGNSGKVAFLFNLIAFQIIWTATVLGSAHLIIWPAIVLCAAFVSIHFGLFKPHSSDIKLILAGIVTGIILDSIWIQTGQLSFTDQRPFAWMTPGWMIILWVGFSLTLNHSLNWLKRHPLLPILFGFFGAPFSYLIGSKLGAVQYQSSFIQVSVLLAISWAIALHILFLIARKHDSSSPT